jgi:putative protease
MSGIRIGKVTHFFDKINVAVLDLTDTLRVGDMVHFLGHSADFKQEVASLQIEHQAVTEAGPGQEVAMKVTQNVHPNDAVFKITGEE